MKKYIIILTAFLFAFSCSDDRETEPYDPSSVNTFEFYIDGEKVENPVYYVSANYLPCDNDIYLRVSLNKTQSSSWAIIELTITKYGKVKYFKMWRGLDTHYTPYYNPNDYVKIKNLQLDPQSPYLKFSFEGSIFEQSTDKPMEISGNFEIKFFYDSYCDAVYNQFIDLNNDIRYINGDIIKTTTTVQGQIINVKYEANEPDGWQFVLNGLKKKIYDMDLGTYDFDFSRENEFIEFNEYIGPPKSIFSTVLPTDWLKYDTSGSFTISKHELIDGHKVTKGTINLNAYENGTLIKSFENAPFELSDN
ncbi:MAG: hypothetical protein LBE36_11015 [Flavobacteriaceae bacterium]|jgi:hypothetical protein|nr:hypothetical protein [Flavobacteriaceae bacterium]